MKNLLITGGSQGIGKATALEAAKKGMFIGINYNSNDKAAEETLSEVKELGGEGVILKCCLLYTSPSPRDPKSSRMPSSA